MSPKSHNVEFVAVLDLDAPPSPDRVEPIAHSILTREAKALSQTEEINAGHLSLV
jgi:hypothetical protein